jgi:hypothetical protein
MADCELATPKAGKQLGFDLVGRSYSGELARLQLGDITKCKDVVTEWQHRIQIFLGDQR